MLDQSCCIQLAAQRIILPIIAKNQLQYAGPEFSTYENPKTVGIFNRAIEAVMLGEKEPAPAMKEAQAAIEKILKDYR